MATIKKGTYRFNDVLTAPSEGSIVQDINFVFTADDSYFTGSAPTITTTAYAVQIQCAESLDVGYRVISTDPDVSQLGVSLPGTIWAHGGGGWYEIAQTITIPTDQEVSDEFATWFTANTKPLTTIEYNGAVIASLKAGQSATLECKDLPMLDNVVVSVPDGYIIPSGEETITQNGSYDVTEKASVTVNVEAEDSAVPTEISTEAEMNALLESGELGGIYKYVGASGTYENGALYVLKEVDYAAELVGTWTLSPSNLDMRMIDGTINMTRWDITGYCLLDGQLSSITYYTMAFNNAFGFALMDYSSRNGVAFLLDYPNMMNPINESIISDSENNRWTEFSTFTINSVPDIDEARLSTVLAFLQANAAKQ